MKTRNTFTSVLVVAVAAVLMLTTIVLAQSSADTIIPRVPNPPLASDLASLPGDLRAVAVPTPSNLAEFVRDPAMAIALGKALFWDMQVGSDSKGFGTEGAFKVPSLRNVTLTAPYFHDGGTLTLREVVELYSRGGNVAPITELDGTPIEPLGIPLLTSDEIDAIVAFLETLTDERVVYQRAPFDHPQLFVPNGHPGNFIWTIDANNDGLADDLMIEIPAVGAAGGAPLPGFLQGIFGS